MNLYTIGFTKKSAEQFFESIAGAHVRRIIDVRLNNVSQLAGFAKRDDLSYLLMKICNVEYVHEPRLAPTSEILRAYRKKSLTWSEYEQAFNSLMVERRVADWMEADWLNQSGLLCSEAAPAFCHRRLIADIAQRKHPTLQIHHLT